MRIIKLFVVFFWIIPIVWASQYQEPHNFGGRCFDCHVDLENPRIFNKDPEILCLSCHPEGKEQSHPSGVIPGKELPLEFPLYQGKLNCLSCHIAHTPYYAKDGQQKGVETTPSLLRVQDTGEDFCAHCHRDNTPENKADAHALAFQRAHSLGYGMSVKKIHDENSDKCLRCHENARNMHSFGSEYAKIYLKHPELYHPPSALDARVRLINGTVGCQTCHDDYSKYPYLMIIETTREKLCVQCHNL